MDKDTISFARYQREKLARKEAEDLLESQSAESYELKEVQDKISEHQKMVIEAQIAELKEEAKTAIAANKSKSMFLANMSHELRTPLHGILSYSEMGLNRADKSTPDKNKRYFENIYTSGERLLVLVNDLLDLAKLESGKLELSYSKVSIKELVFSCIDELAIKIEERNIQIETPNHDVELECDQKLMGQVIRNLFSNAFKFSPNDKRILFRYQLVDEGEKLHFSIQDQGAGIEEKLVDKVFEKFIQDETKEAGTNMGSTGLGLAISKKIIEDHGGRIWAETSINEKIGGVFCFEIPVKFKN